MQSSLNAILGLRLPLDGIMGPETRSAVRSFQQKRGLPVDGIIGPDTERALIAARGSGPPASGKELETAWGSQALEMEVNRRSRDYIRWVQRSLNRILGLRLAVDGLMGQKTRSAIRRFQERSGLKADGIVGSKTEAAIQAALRTVDASTAPCTGQPTGVIDGFGFDSARVPSSHRTTVARLANQIVTSQGTSRPIRGLCLVGHTDPVGSTAYNETLGRRRAEQVRDALRSRLDSTRAGLSSQITFVVQSRGESQPIPRDPARSRRVEVFVKTTTRPPLPRLSSAEQRAFNRLSSQAQSQFNELRRTIETYVDVARREADRGSRVLLQRGVFRALPRLLPELVRLTRITALPPGWTTTRTKPLLVGNVLYNLAFPETINQGGTDRLGGKPDPTCFSASTQILLARRFPATYVRYVIDLATTRRVRFAGGDDIGPLTFVSTSLYKSLDSVLLQTAFDTYFDTKARNVNYRPGDELKVHRQIFGANRPPRSATWTSKSARIAAFRRAFITRGGNTRLWEIANLCTGNPANPATCGNHTVVVTRITNGRVYFYNPWANEEEKNTMFGPAQVTVSGNGERPAESSMRQADFENQLTTVFHN